MKGCIILFGASFRLGCQGNINIGSKESFEGQINASKSQMEFINHLNDKNVKIDVYISTYDTIFKDDLTDIFKDNLIGCDIYKKLIGQGNLIQNSIKKIKVSEYDFLLFMRIDLFIKKKMHDIFNPNWDKFMWPSICSQYFWNKVFIPRINDMMHFIPKKYYDYLKYFDSEIMNRDAHSLWVYLLKNTDLTIDCLDTMLTTYHDSDSYKDFNPLYYIANRNECTIEHSKGLYFNKYSNYS
jgi:hypothetical protein